METAGGAPMEPGTKPPMEPGSKPPMGPGSKPPMGRSAQQPRVVNLVLHLRVPGAKADGGGGGEYRRRLCSERDGGGGEWPSPSPALLAIPGVELVMPRKKSVSVKRRNFYLLRMAGHIYTVFPASGDVVVNGVPNEGRAREAVRCLSLALGHPQPGVPAGRWGEKVVNSTYTGRLPPVAGGVHRSLLALKHDASDEAGEYKRGLSVSTRSQLFPGVLLRWKGLGTVNVFSKGTYFMVGVKSRDVASDLHWRMLVATEKYSTTLTRRTSSAPSAVSYWKSAGWAAQRLAASSVVAAAAGEKKKKEEKEEASRWTRELGGAGRRVAARRGERAAGGRARLHGVIASLSARSS